MDNPLWEFSLSIYALDNVAPTCLALQDQFGLDVNLLLYAAWLADADRLLTLDHLTELDALVADWRANVIRPLRALRRQLRDYSPAAGVAMELNVAEELKALELRAERQQQNRMYAFSTDAPALPQADYPLSGNLALVAQFASPANAGWATIINYLITLLPRG